jgi:hypothetical protein
MATNGTMDPTKMEKNMGYGFYTMRMEVNLIERTMKRLRKL